LLQPVVLLVLTILGVVSHLRREIHDAKVSIIIFTAVFYNAVLAYCRANWLKIKRNFFEKSSKR
ncbi:MAG: hypothetical protein IJ910_03545, partial [Bacteroidaceae bacterium]|nr:hypothetical protein [Bacteroidaceae bacterium]